MFKKNRYTFMKKGETKMNTCRFHRSLLASILCSFLIIPNTFANTSIIETHITQYHHSETFDHFEDSYVSFSFDKQLKMEGLQYIPTLHCISSRHGDHYFGLVLTPIDQEKRIQRKYTNRGSELFDDLKCDQIREFYSRAPLSLMETPTTGASTLNFIAPSYLLMARLLDYYQQKQIISPIGLRLKIEISNNHFYLSSIPQ